MTRFNLAELGPTPEIHNKRLDLMIGHVTAFGLACFLGGAVAPALDPSRAASALIAIGGVAMGGLSFLAAWRPAAYIRTKE
jgi:hypothetical protein